MKKDYVLSLKINNYFDIKDKELFYNDLIKNKYELFESYILNNNYIMVQYCINLFKEKNDFNYLNIFKPGFFRNEKILKRQIPNYILIQSSKEMIKLLMFFKEIRNISLNYSNNLYF